MNQDNSAEKFGLPTTTITPKRNITATREDALRHVRAVEILHRRGTPISTPIAYFNEQISAIEAQLERERSLDPHGDEMTRIRDYMTVEEYFNWLEGVLAYQRAYRDALQS